MNSYNRHQDTTKIIETIQEFYSATLEYYDELFPYNKEAIDFISSLRKEQGLEPDISTPKPLCRYLGIGSATGNFEIEMSKLQYDVTAIDRNSHMVDTAHRRLKRSVSNARFFEMSALEMARFLSKNSFNIVASLNNMLPYIADETLLRKFFYDAKTLLAPNGVLAVEFINFDNSNHQGSFELKTKSSIRVSLTRSLHDSSDGMKELDSELELGNGSILKLAPDVKLFPIRQENISAWSKEAGFTNIRYFGDLKMNEWTKDSINTIAVLS